MLQIQLGASLAKITTLSEKFQPPRDASSSKYWQWGRTRLQSLLRWSFFATGCNRVIHFTEVKTKAKSGTQRARNLAEPELKPGGWCFLISGWDAEGPTRRFLGFQRPLRSFGDFAHLASSCSNIPETRNKATDCPKAAFTQALWRWMSLRPHCIIRPWRGSSENQSGSHKLPLPSPTWGSLQHMDLLAHRHILVPPLGLNLCSFHCKAGS